MFDVLWMNVAAVFALLNVAFVGLLIFAYVQSWRKVPSGFTLSLIFFAAFFLIQNLVVILFWYVLYTTVAEPVVVAAAPYLAAVNAAEAIGLAMLTRSTWR